MTPKPSSQASIELKQKIANLRTRLKRQNQAHDDLYERLANNREGISPSEHASATQMLRRYENAIHKTEDELRTLIAQYRHRR